jgi:uncharacterized protein YigE (DUF2233 family)
LCFSLLLVFAFLFLASAHGAQKAERYISYTNVVFPQIPLSIHVVKVDRTREDLRLHTTLGGGEVMGMGNVTDQLKSLPAELGTPLAAINGDFYEKAKDYPGRPRDLQIRNGEVLTHPAGHACFWIDADGTPRMTNVYSRFRVTWPDGNSTPFGLNVERTNGTAVLYSAVLGDSTMTSGGIEYVLEGSPGCEWLPLRAGKTYEAVVRQMTTNGNSRLDRQTVVLSVSPELGAGLKPLKPGARVKFALETTPAIVGVEVAIGGGPELVRAGQVMSWKGWIHVPHPRTAVGWNKDHIFLVQVDGRQLDVSLGMTFSELADFMLKLGCENAMNLDGGGSATLWAFGAVRNSPSEGQERPAPNALVVVKKSSPRQTR